MQRIAVESVDLNAVPTSPSGRTPEGEYAVPTNRKSKVAIVGFASSSKDLAPFSDTDCEIWGMNELYNSVPRIDRLFEMHTWDHLNRTRVRGNEVVVGEDHIGWMKRNQSALIYMQEARPEIPRSVRFPMEYVTKAFFPDEGVPYFTSTPAYMLALAVLEGFKTIGLYGIDLLSDDEYEYQRPCMEYLVGVARGLGCAVYIPKTSALVKANYLYGLSEPPAPEQVDEFLASISAEEEKMRARLTQIEFQRHTLSGAVQTLQSMASWLRHFKRGGRVGGKPGTGTASNSTVTVPPITWPKEGPWPQNTTGAPSSTTPTDSASNAGGTPA